MAKTWTRYWPWWVLLAWLVGYELVALSTQVFDLHPRIATFSELVWQADARWPMLPWVVVPIVVVLLWHFFGQRRRP